MWRFGDGESSGFVGGGRRSELPRSQILIKLFQRASKVTLRELLPGLPKFGTHNQKRSQTPKLLYYNSAREAMYSQGQNGCR